MSNEEAINILYGIREYYASLTVGYPPHDCYGLGDMKCSDICNALLKSIKLLKQEPCEDAISRQAVEETIFEQGSAEKLEIDFAKLLLLQRAIKALPSVTPQPKTGKWVKYSIPRCGEQHYKCTSCGYYINFGQWGELYTKEFNFCPNCGARMESEGEEV